MGIICTRDRERATAFYRDTLGLTFASEDNFAAVSYVGGVTLRVSSFHVPDVAAAVKTLREKGVTFNIYPSFQQDDLGILTLPGGTARVACFKDPDGNVLSVPGRTPPGPALRAQTEADEGVGRRPAGLPHNATQLLLEERDKLHPWIAPACPGRHGRRSRSYSQPRN